MQKRDPALKPTDIPEEMIEELVEMLNIDSVEAADLIMFVCRELCEAEIREIIRGIIR